MDRSVALQQLPAFHAVAIRLRDDGLGDHVIAVALGIDDDQVPVLLQIAESKLSNLISLDDSPPWDGSDRSATQQRANQTTSKGEAQ